MRKIAVVWFFLLFIQFGKAETDRFYSTRDGLSGTYFHDVLQDSKGYLWICTRSGLNKFDGYNFTIYQFDANDTTSLNTTLTTCIFEDRSGRVWVGTNIGLNLYVPEKDNFKRIKLYFNNLPFNVSIRHIFQDSGDNLYLVTSNGLIRINLKTNKQEIFNTQFDSNGFPSHTQFNHGMFDEKGNIWIATTKQKILVFDTEKNTFSNLANYLNLTLNLPDINYMILHKAENGEIVISGQKGDVYIYSPFEKKIITIELKDSNGNRLQGGVSSVCSDNSGTVWLGTEYHGLKILNLKERKIYDANEQLDVENVERSKVYCYTDRNGDLWFAVNYIGLIHKLKSLQKFNTIAAKNNVLGNHLVKAILKDNNGDLWIGTDGGGLSVLDGKSHIRKLSPNTDLFSGKAILSLHQDKRGWIWIGTYLDGLYCYKPGSGFEKIPNLLSGTDNPLNNIFSIKEDESGNIWIATNGSGLICYDVSKKTAHSYNTFEAKNGQAYIPKYINDIVVDKDGTIWIASYYGIFSWNFKTEIFTDYNRLYPVLNDEIVYDIEKAPRNLLVMAGFSGFWVFDINNKEIHKYTSEKGLPGNCTLSVMPDSLGEIWISTTNGLACFNVQSQKIKSYYSYDGLPCNEFMYNAAFYDKSQNLYFGGVNGLVYFNSADIIERKGFPNLVFSNLRIQNVKVKNGARFANSSEMNKVINFADTLILNYNDRNFSFEFAAIDFTAPEKIKYAVMIEGFDKDWNIKDYKQRYASYTNLNPGKYTLWVKSTNTDGSWIEPGRKLTVIVKSPFWFTWWAFAVYVVILSLVVFLLRSAFIFRIRMQSKLHLEQMERQRQESSNQAKLQFFTNVSHEIRTPLSMILAPLNKLIQTNLSEAQINYVSFIERNTKRLERMVNQLLEVQRIEKQELKFQPKVQDMVSFIQEILYLFEGAVKEKQMELVYEPLIESLPVLFDSDMMDKIMFNLVSNAIKYTPKGGFISVELNVRKDTNANSTAEWCEIKVSDTGRGIAPEHLDKIFDRFYQARNQGEEFVGGTGIGLHIVKSFVEAHKGTIRAVSELKKGTAITFTIPVESSSSSYIQPKELKPETKTDKEKVSPQAIAKTAENEKHSVLIVEDDKDLLGFLKSELGNTYQVWSATDGDNGWKLACKHLPSLIISDISMPGMNGIELCGKLKTTFETSHIPVILLTARTAVEHEIQGVEKGADEYIHKPFNTTLLKVKVEKLIESREALKQKFSKGVQFTAKEMTVTSSDEKFLQKAINCVMENLSDPDFSIETMCNQIGVSRVHLYRKIKSLTNQVPSEFIRILRLKQAAYLLEQDKLNVSEIAYKVGFNSHQYFTNSFQNYFNMSPKEYAALKNHKSEPEI